jgi:hypothetical protein
MISPVALILQNCQHLFRFEFLQRVLLSFMVFLGVFYIYSNPLCFMISVADFSGIIGGISNKF